MGFFSLLSVLLLVSSYSPTTACPAECNCFGFNGEWIADCARKELTSVTYGDFDGNTTEIHMQYNFIESLPEDAFATVPNLKHLYLQSNRIASLPQNIFGNLGELQTLRLNANKVSDIGTARFENLTKLQLLYIHNNDLKEVQDDAFTGLDAVEQISVAMNPNLASIGEAAFYNLATIKMIDISGSALTRLNSIWFTGPNPLISSIDPEKIYMYDIDTLICDEQLETFLQWMNRPTNLRRAFGRATMVCDQPENLKGRSVTVVDPDRHYTVAGACPTECSCFNSGASYIADCSSRGLTEIPSNFAPETTEIFLQNNQIQTVSPYNFLHLTKLEYLFLHQNAIDLVDLNAFSGPVGLKQLTLNNNNISAITVGVFNNLMTLEILNLNHNKLTRIQPNYFPSMTSLAQFSANGNSIRIVLAGSFDSMVSLKYFGMAQNNLEQLPDGIWGNNGNLYFIDISENSFNSLPAIPSSVSVFEARDCSILSLSPESFQTAGNLETLELSNNRIYRIEVNTFAGATRLRTLRLDNNALESIENNYFLDATSLVVLDLSDNAKLTHLSDYAFSAQRYNLQRLYLNDCAMSTTNGRAFTSLEHPNLYVQLAGNPWNCDCGLEDFSDVLRSSLATDAPKCQNPESENGKPITDVDYVLACSDPETIDPEPASDQTALIISLTIVLAVLLFGVVMLIVLRQSKKRKAIGNGHRSSADRGAHSNDQYVSDEKGLTGL